MAMTSIVAKKAANKFRASPESGRNERSAGLSKMQKRFAGAIAVAAVIGGAVNSCHQPGNTTGQPGYAALKSVAFNLDKPLCTAKYTASVKNVKANYNKPIDIFPDFDRTIKLSGKYDAQICTKTTKTVANYDPKTKQFVVKLHADSNPKKSDLSLITYPNGEIKTEKEGSFVSDLADAAASDINAIPGVNIRGGGDLDDNLRDVASLIAQQQVAKPCGALALKKLQDPNAQKENSPTSTTFSSDLAKTFVTFTNKFHPGSDIPESAVRVVVTGGEHGLPNQNDARYQQLVEEGPKHHLRLPKDENLPKCHDETVGN